jgi:hypothetical protein
MACCSINISEKHWLSTRGFLSFINMTSSIRIGKLVFYFALFTIIVGCSKRQSTYYIQDSLKEWTFYKTGSYWIFLNETSQNQDSLFIDEDPTSYFTPPEPTNTQYEIIKYEINNGFLTTGTLSAGMEDNAFFVFSDFQSGGMPLSTWIINGKSSSISTYSWLIKRFDTLTINKTLFYDVIHTRDSSEKGRARDYYFVKNIGLVKFSIRTAQFDSTWSLLRWHVVQ